MPLEQPMFVGASANPDEPTEERADEVESKRSFLDWIRRRRCDRIVPATLADEDRAEVERLCEALRRITKARTP